MRESARVRDSDLRAMLRLAAEAGELPAGTDERRRHLLDGLRRLVGGQSAALFLLGRDPVGGPLSDGGPLVWASMPPEHRAAYDRLIRHNPPPRNPIVPLLLRSKNPLITQHRRQVADERTWYHSAFYQQFQRPLGLDDMLYAKAPLPGGRMLAVAAVRHAGERPFGDRECRLVDLFHREAVRLYGMEAAPAPPADPGTSTDARASTDARVSALPPRLKPVLKHLLQGEGEKQVAANLGLSRHTVHDYIKSLYRQLGVCSRGELMAAFVQSPRQA